MPLDKEYLKILGFVVCIAILLILAVTVIDTFSSMVAATAATKVANEGDSIGAMVETIYRARVELYSLELDPLDPGIQKMRSKALEQLELAEDALRQLESCIEEK